MPFFAFSDSAVGLGLISVSAGLLGMLAMGGKKVGGEINNKSRVCLQCKGKKFVLMPCKCCQATGYVTRVVAGQETKRRCPECDGEKGFAQPCPICSNASLKSGAPEKVGAGAR
eukprot:tig00021501_g21959.t1